MAADSLGCSRSGPWWATPNLHTVPLPRRALNWMPLALPLPLAGDVDSLTLGDLMDAVKSFKQAWKEGKVTYVLLPKEVRVPM